MVWAGVLCGRVAERSVWRFSASLRTRPSMPAMEIPSSWLADARAACVEPEEVPSRSRTRSRTPPPKELNAQAQTSLKDLFEKQMEEKIMDTAAWTGSEILDDLGKILGAAIACPPTKIDASATSAVESAFLLAAQTEEFEMRGPVGDVFYREHLPDSTAKEAYASFKPDAKRLYRQEWAHQRFTAKLEKSIKTKAFTSIEGTKLSYFTLGSLVESFGGWQ